MTSETPPIELKNEEIAVVERLKNAFARLKAEMGKVIVGQESVLEELLIAIFARGHCLLIGVPGLAKTLMIQTLADSLNLAFNRVQFTPDLMPADITGTEVIQEEKATGIRQFKFLRGPIFANIVLADEINRTPPKTQAALLEAMQERQVTVGGERHRLPAPSSSWRRRIRLSRKGLILCPRPSSTASCSTSWWIIPTRRKSSRSCEERHQAIGQSLQKSSQGRRFSGFRRSCGRSRCPTTWRGTQSGSPG